MRRNTQLKTTLMPLKLHPTGLGSGIDKEWPDYTVYRGEWDVGRIYQQELPECEHRILRCELCKRRTRTGSPNISSTPIRYTSGSAASRATATRWLIPGLWFNYRQPNVLTAGRLRFPGMWGQDASPPGAVVSQDRIHWCMGHSRPGAAVQFAACGPPLYGAGRAASPPRATPVANG
jgi:hypothetical protein